MVGELECTYAKAADEISSEHAAWMGTWIAGLQLRRGQQRALAEGGEAGGGYGCGCGAITVIILL